MEIVQACLFSVPISGTSGVSEYFRITTRLLLLSPPKLCLLSASPANLTGRAACALVLCFTTCRRRNGTRKANRIFNAYPTVPIPARRGEDYQPLGIHTNSPVLPQFVMTAGISKHRPNPPGSLQES